MAFVMLGGKADRPDAEPVGERSTVGGPAHQVPRDGARVIEEVAQLAHGRFEGGPRGGARAANAAQVGSGRDPPMRLDRTTFRAVLNPSGGPSRAVPRRIRLDPWKRLGCQAFRFPDEITAPARKETASRHEKLGTEGTRIGRRGPPDADPRDPSEGRETEREEDPGPLPVPSPADPGRPEDRSRASHRPRALVPVDLARPERLRSRDGPPPIPGPGRRHEPNRHASTAQARPGGGPHLGDLDRSRGDGHQSPRTSGLGAAPATYVDPCFPRFSIFAYTSLGSRWAPNAKNLSTAPWRTKSPRKTGPTCSENMPSG